MDFSRFRFIDAVTAFDRADGTLVATCHVPVDLSVFEVHFPGHPLLPGVFALEMMNQAAGVLLWDAMDRIRIPLFCQAKALHLRDAIHPGDTVAIHASRVHVGSGYGVARSRIVRGPTLIADAEIMFRALAFPSPDAAAIFGLEGGALLDRLAMVP